MKTLHRYLLKQVLVTLLMTVLVFTFVLLLGNLFKEILMLLVNRQITFGILFEALGLLVPFTLAFALPMGMLTATLLVFGRFSADQELTAAKASGISLLSLAGPLVSLSLLLCVVCAAVNMKFAPQCRVAYKQLLFRAGVQQPGMMFPEGQFVTDFNDCIFYVGKNDGKTLKDILVFLMPDHTNIVMKIHAPRGSFNYDEVNRQVEVKLYEARSVSAADGRWLPQYLGEWTYQPDMKRLANFTKRTSLSNMTFSQLRNELADMERRIRESALFRTSPTASLTAAGKSAPGLRTPAELTSPIKVLMNRQVAFSFACLGFTLVGIPLAIRVHRRETNIGFALALGLVVIYYAFLILGESLAPKAALFPQLIVWIPNFIFQGVGAVMLWRANKGI